MALVTVRINGFNHVVGCADGQEAHLQAMATEVDRRIESIRAGAGAQNSEARLLVLAALMLADENHDLRAEGAAAPREVVREVRVEVPMEVPVAVPMPDAVFADRLGMLARRAEEIAAGLERL